MSISTSFAAQILETSASAYAGSATNLLLERQSGMAERFAPSALKDWRAHLRQRVLELSAALGAEEPGLFSSRVQWERKAFQARGLSDQDLRSALVCLREVLWEELPEMARDSAASYLDLALGRLHDPMPADIGLDSSNPHQLRALQYLEAALKGNASDAIQLIVDAVSEGLSVQDAYDTLLAAQRETGRMWHMGKLEIAEEHVVTATTERAVATLAGLAPQQSGNGKTVIIAAVAGNRHSLAVRILADFFEIDGWRSICMGADVPAADLATATLYFDADLLALSVALPTQIKAARRTIELVRAHDERNIKILVGGVAFAETPELWRQLGADGSILEADAAVALGERLVGLEP